MSIFQEILDCRSMTVIEYSILDALSSASAEDRLVLERMLNTNKLDEVYALAHEHLGQHEKAAQLREWLSAQAARPKAVLRF